MATEAAGEGLLVENLRQGMPRPGPMICTPYERQGQWGSGGARPGRG